MQLGGRRVPCAGGLPSHHAPERDTEPIGTVGDRRLCGGRNRAALARLIAFCLALGGRNRADLIVDPSMIVEVLPAVLAAGFFLVVPVAGVLAVGRCPIREGTSARLAIVTCAGIAVCSVPLMASLIFRVYSPPLLGGIGWLVCVAWVVLTRPRLPAIGRLTGARVALLAGLVVVAVLYLGAPRDPIAGGRDMAVYANHAIYMAHHGRLDIPYPDGVEPGALPPGWVSYSGVYSTEPTMTVQFAHVYPAWLAQAFAAFGYGGMLRLNAVLAVLSLVAVFALARRYMPESIAVLAVLFLAFDAGQVWVVRNTLTEPMTQLFAVTGLLLLAAQNPARPRVAAVWAGVAIGMTALVRLDSFVLLPLLIVGHTLASLLARSGQFAPRVTEFYAAALPMFGLATAYYVAFSRPYLIAHLSVVLPIAVATVFAALVFAVSRLPRIHALGRNVLVATGTLVVASVTVLLLAGYAYFIRPRIGPFQMLLVDSPVPLRSHVEDAMRNLAAYVTPVVLWMAIVGWVVAMAFAVRHRMVVLLPVLVLIGGFSAMYFWNQAVTPDHFWAIRRFMPIILPATILLAAYVGWMMVSRVPLPWRRVLIGIAALALAAQSYRIGNPMYWVAERSGVYAAIEEFAADIPADHVLIGPLNRTDIHTFGTALLMSFDKPVLAVSYEADGGRDELLSRMREASLSRPVLAIASGDRVGWLEGEIVASMNQQFEVMTPTFQPVPQLVASRDLRLALVQVTGLNTLGSELGPSNHWLVRESGFYRTEAQGTARWTDGNAVLHVPIAEDEAADRLEIDLLWTGPLGATVEIFYNDHSLFSEYVPSGEWQRTFDLPAASDIGGEAEIRLESSTFVPADVMEGSTDQRTLGIMVRGLRLLSANP